MQVDWSLDIRKYKINNGSEPGLRVCTEVELTSHYYYNRDSATTTLLYSIRRGGGKAHGPTRRDFATSFNRRQRKMALRVVLSQKLREGRLTVVPSLDVEPRTRIVAAALRKRDMASALFVDDVIEEGLRRAVANAPRVDALPQIGANVYDILRRDHLVLSESAAFSLAGRLVGR